MTRKNFDDCMRALESLAPRALPEGAKRIFWERLQEHGISDEVFARGSGLLVDTHHFKHFPSIAEVLESCQKATQQSAAQEYQKNKTQEDRFRNVEQAKILKKGLKGNPPARALVQNALNLLNGAIDLKAWAAEQRSLLSQYNLRDERTLAELWRIEKKLEAGLYDEANRI